MMVLYKMNWRRRIFMKTSSARNVRSWLWGGLLLCLAPVGVSHAATVAIDSLLINYASLTIAITGDGSTTYSGPVVPPVQIVMGEYQDPIIQLTGGSYSARIYSTGAFGLPAPSGSVDTVAGTINVDFSSLRANATTSNGSLDMALWLITGPPSGGAYDPGTGAYTLTWSNPFSVPLTGGRAITGNATVSLSGTATLVPVPAALWLLGSGLLGLAGVARRRRAHAC
jgi:hypothetical protein